MAKTGWKCETCKHAGVIKHDASADVYSMIAQLHEAHDTASPDCDSRIGSMRVWPVRRAPLPGDSNGC